MAEAPIVVWGIVATFRRAEMLRGLLATLQAPENPVAGLVVVDNADDPATREVVARAGMLIEYILPGRNLSCGGGVARGLQAALSRPEATHFWIMDDDTTASPGAMTALAETMRAAQADVAVPLVVTEEGVIEWPPGLLDKARLRTVRSRCTPAEYVRQHGLEPCSFSWTPWPSIMVSRAALEREGLPRDDFWLTGEDLEFGLRLTWKGRGILVPAAVCAHLPPAGDPVKAHFQHYLKFLSMLQNSSYISFHLRHGRRILRHIPGNTRRFFRTFGVTRRSLRDVARALWWGIVRGRPAGHPGFTEFRERYFAPPP